jgi:hypothetical protein
VISSRPSIVVIVEAQSGQTTISRLP